MSVPSVHGRVSLTQLRASHLWGAVALGSSGVQANRQGVGLFCQYLSLSNKVSLSLVSGFRETPRIGWEHPVWEDDCVGVACICLLRLGFYTSP